MGIETLDLIWIKTGLVKQVKKINRANLKLKLNLHGQNIAIQ
jgi:hypothetical protein